MNYDTLYEQLIINAKNDDRVKGDIYYENHHIIPKSWCNGDMEYMVKDKRNLVLLTAKEHYLAHHLLMKMYPENRSMVSAFWAMTNKNRNKHIVTAIQYESAKKAQAKCMSERIVTEETKQKQSDYWKGRMVGDKNPNYGNKWSDEQRERMSRQRKGLTLNGTNTKGKSITPWGNYTSINAAIKSAPKAITYNTLARFCKKSQLVVKKSNLQYTNYLTEDDIGKTFSELGYGYEYKGSK